MVGTMLAMSDGYDPQAIEATWQQRWRDEAWGQTGIVGTLYIINFFYPLPFKL